MRQLQGLRQSDMFARTRVGDYLIDKDRIFAELTLDAEELALYRRVYAHVVGQPLRPDLVIYLQAPVEVLLERIAMRAIPYEAVIDEDYLHRLTTAYTRFFYHYDESPLVIVNAAAIDLATGEADYEELLAQLRTIRKGRHYINPLPF